MGSEARRKIQKALLARGENVAYRSAFCPIVPTVLQDINPAHPMVVKTIEGGLTATIYKLKQGNQFYCLKKKRSTILVQNDDGQLSFLNEILCRKVIERHRDDPIINGGINKTYYADLSEGVILTDWIESDVETAFNRKRIKNTFALTLALEKIGLFEWDLCPGNLLYKDDQLKLFDFGYMYQMNPMKGINSEGMEASVFHRVERLETRALMQQLLDLEVAGHLEDALDLFRITKEEGILTYEEKLTLLKDMTSPLYDYYTALIAKWRLGLRDPMQLKALYDRERMRSYALDIHDDLTGKTCTVNTLSKIDHMLHLMPTMYQILKECGELLWFDKDLSLEGLMNVYHERRQAAKAYQIKGQ